MTLSDIPIPAGFGRYREASRQKFLGRCETFIIYSSIVALPFNNFPVIHELCLPLVALGVTLLFLRGQGEDFVVFVRQFRAPLLFSAVFLFACLGSIFFNLAAVTGNDLRGTAGWPRAQAQIVIAACMVFYPFYLAYCLSKRSDWLQLVRRAIWISLPIPLLVAALQLADFVGVPGTSALPLVKHYESGFWRLNSVSVEAAWFDIYISIIFPFLVVDFIKAKGHWPKRLGVGVVLGMLVIFFLAGLSKTPDIAALVEALATLCVVAFFWRPAPLARAMILIPIAAAWIVTAMWVFAPEATEKDYDQIADKVALVFGILGPLLTGNLHIVDIGTRFGMSYAGLLMWWNHPLFGVGLGQFAYNVRAYLPAWGLNVETQQWLSGDEGSWPAATVLYIRLLSECGIVGFLGYFLFRLHLLYRLIRILKDRDNPLAFAAASVFAGSVSVMVFDMSRDTFINLDLWVVLGLSLVLIHAQRRQDAAADKGKPLPSDPANGHQS